MLFNKLINIIIKTIVSLTLLQNTIIENYQESQTIIDLIFTINNIINRLIKYKIDKEIKNLSNYLSIQTIIDLKIYKKSARRSRCY